MSKVSLWFKVIWAALWSRSTRTFYNRISSIYDEVFIAHRVHAESILRILNDIFSSREHKTSVLDLGCGTGMLSIMLADGGFEVVGVDISFPALCILRQHNPDVQIIQADANFLSVPSESFDVVVCLGAWRHFGNPDAVLREISRVLTHDGVFIVGYFPPAIAGVVHVNQNPFGNSLIWLYELITLKLGYLDQADFSLEDQTEQAIQKQFKVLSKEITGSDKLLLVARHPLTRL